MSKVEDLLEKYCPNGVPYVEMEELFRIRKGENLTIEKAEPGIYPVVTASRGSNFSHKDFNFDGEFITISSHGAYAGHVSYFHEKFWLGNNVYLLESFDNDVSVRFYLHVLKSQAHTLTGTVHAGGIPYINAKDLLRLSLPKPPIQIQLEIVAILDKFTLLEAELEAELEGRKSQFDYYRDLILGFGNKSLKWVRFGDVATIVRGASPRPIQKFLTDAEDGIPWIKIGDTEPGEKYVVSTAQKISQEGAKNSRFVSPGDFILSNSMSFGRPYISKIYGCIHDGWLAISDFESNLNSDYLYHVLQSHAMQMEFSQRASNGTVSNLNADIVKSVKVPVPLLEVQEQIAGVLNNFEVLVNSAEIGIPGEIVARRQQYEHYRNKLLNFKALEVA